jgi:hypothetical protein
MKIRPFIPLSRCLILGSMLMATACQKESKSSSSDNSAAASLSDSSTTADNAYSDGMTNAFYGYSDNVPSAIADKHSGGVSTNSTATNGVSHFACAIPTLTTTDGGFPVSLSLDFGDGCASADSIIRKGKITYTYSGPIYTPGTVVSAVFDHYYVNNYGLQGTYSITNSSTDTLPQFVSQVTNGIFSYPDGTNFHYTSNKVVSMTGGTLTPFYFLDDVYSITGISNFSTSDGNSVVTTITTPLVKSVICPSISSGVISFVYNVNFKGTIDFGDGSCDNSATVKVGSLEKTIVLR